MEPGHGEIRNVSKRLPEGTGTFNTALNLSHVRGKVKRIAKNFLIFSKCFSAWHYDWP